MILSTIPETTPDGQAGSVSLNTVIMYGDKMGDTALVITMFVILLVLITVGLLTAILRDEIQNLYVVDFLNPEGD